MKKTEDFKSDFKPDYKGDRDMGGGPGGEGKGGEKRGFQKRRGCRLCGENAPAIDYKDKYLLGNYVTERFKIVPRRISGTCSACQRKLTIAIKRARHVAILAYTTAHV